MLKESRKLLQFSHSLFCRLFVEFSKLFVPGVRAQRNQTSCRHRNGRAVSTATPEPNLYFRSETFFPRSSTFLPLMCIYAYWMSTNTGFQYFEFDTHCFVFVCRFPLAIIGGRRNTSCYNSRAMSVPAGSSNTIHLTAPLHTSCVWKSPSQVWLLKAVDWPLDNFDVFNKYRKEKQVNVGILTRHCHLLCSFSAPRFLLTLHKKQWKTSVSVFLVKKVAPGLFRMRGFYGCHYGHPLSVEARVLTESSSGESYKTTLVSVM